MAEVRVKICGVARPEGAALAAELGAAYLGLNFCVESPRAIDLDCAREIASAVAGRARLVGVFVNRPGGEVAAIAAEVGLDLVQFSGDESPSAVAPFAGRAIKAFRTGGHPGAAALAEYGDLWAWLFDAPHGTLYGGIGESWDYAALPLAALAAGGRRVFLAGGIGPANARQVVAACRPFAIDVCSRVESSPGIKDPALLRRLFEEIADA